MKFEALQARYGDCLFLTFEDGALTRRLLVDGGPAGVYRTALQPRLVQERSGLRREDALVIDAVMVSHIDEDHILGILDMFGELQDLRQRRAPWPYRPTWLLYNSLDSLAGEGVGGLARGAGGETVLANLGGGISLGRDLAGLDPIAEHVLQSYGQGSRLSTLSAALEIDANPPDKKVLMLAQTTPRVLLLGEASLTIVGPMESDVEKLRKKWSKWKAKQEPPAALVAYVDKSVPNLSSIVTLVQHRGKKVLLTGDARGDKILEGLKLSGIWSGHAALKVDILKIPHHGSSRNLDVEFFKSVHAKHYVVSGDGTYGNPDREALLMIEKARPTGTFSVHMTYEAAKCDITYAQWLDGRGKGPFQVGRDSIDDIVQRWKSEGRITVHEGPVSIDL